ncbi:MAG: hypothetical protein MMC33_010079 [Icmadophila ericetorum]|nr:hypothetical protein [Icmadophila ericetorum]
MSIVPSAPSLKKAPEACNSLAIRLNSDGEVVEWTPGLVRHNRTSYLSLHLSLQRLESEIAAVALKKGTLAELVTRYKTLHDMFGTLPERKALSLAGKVLENMYIVHENLDAEYSTAKDRFEHHCYLTSTMSGVLPEEIGVLDEEIGFMVMGLKDKLSLINAEDLKLEIERAVVARESSLKAIVHQEELVEGYRGKCVESEKSHDRLQKTIDALEFASLQWEEQDVRQ